MTAATGAWRGQVLLCLLCAAAFWPALSATFVDWDDPINITQNPHVMKPGPAGLLFLFTHEYNNLYIPLVYASYTIDMLIGRGNPQVFHAINLLIHMVSSCLVFGLLRRIRAGGGGTGGGGTGAEWAAVAGAALFAVHPLQAESVAWVTGRKDLLCGLFSLLALTLHWDRDPGGDGVPRSPRRTAAVAGCMLLALMCKPTAVALPLMLLAVDWFLLRVDAVAALRRTWPCFVLAIAWFLLTRSVQEIGPEIASKYPAVWTRPLVAARALLFYAWKTVWPVNLAAVYDVTPAGIASGTLSYAALLLAAGSAWLLFRRRNRAALSGGLALPYLLPVLGFLPFVYQVYSAVADRYMYVPMLGVAAGACVLLESLAARHPRWNGVLRGAAALVVVLLAGLANLQSRTWHDSESLWTNALRVSPRAAVAHTSLAVVMRSKGDLARARQLYERAIELDPRSPEAHNNLGLLLSREGDYARAEKHFRASAELLPGLAVPRANLADVLEKQGRHAEARNCLEEALRIDPANQAIIRRLERLANGDPK